MRFLVDESTGRRLSIFLEKEGHDVVFVGDFMRGETDENILSEAEKENRILITGDKDFGELIFRLGRPSKGVILLRTITTFPQTRLQVLKNLFKFYNPKGKFTVVKETSIRTREL